jgi:hypothetical protein
MTIVQAFKWIHKNNGLMGFYRGVTPRIGLGIWQTICNGCSSRYGVWQRFGQRLSQEIDSCNKEFPVDAELVWSCWSFLAAPNGSIMKTLVTRAWT